MDYNAAALEMHAKYPGKLIVNSLFEVKDRDALSTAYTPGVAEPCRQIKANPDDVYKYTFKGRTVAVVTNGTAVLGLGNIAPKLVCRSWKASAFCLRSSAVSMRSPSA